MQIFGKTDDGSEGTLAWTGIRTHSAEGDFITHGDTIMNGDLRGLDSRCTVSVHGPTSTGTNSGAPSASVTAIGIAPAPSAPAGPRSPGAPGSPCGPRSPWTAAGVSPRW